MKKASIGIAAFAAFAALLPMLMGPSGGYPSNPTFQSETVVNTSSVGTSVVGGLTKNVSHAAFPLTIQGSSTAGSSNGLLITAGANGSDDPLAVNNSANTVNYLVVSGVGDTTFSTGSQFFTGYVAHNLAPTTTHVEINGGNSASISQQNSTGATDSKIWDSYADATTWHGRIVNDAYNAAADWITVTRSAVVPQVISLTGTSFKFSNVSQLVRVAYGLCPSAGGTVSSSTQHDNIASCGTPVSGGYPVTFSSAFAAAPNCTATSWTIGAFVTISSVSTSGANVQMNTSAGAATNGAFSLTCQGTS